jgi:alanine racemase-like protein
MTLTLYVDGPRWRSHLTRTAAATPGLVPVAKGNGYGFGVPRLARRAEWLGADTVAVGTYDEVADVDRRFSGTVLVMQPWRPFGHDDATTDLRLVHTVGRLEDLAALGRRADRPRVVLEALTSMRRHGLVAADLATARISARGVRVEGHALHLPIGGGGHLAEVERWLAAAPADRWYVSHLAADELAELRRRHPEVEFRPRIGTALWLGERAALAPKATVLDVHPVRRGDRVGYRQRRILRAGWLLVVSGGTAHGIGLEAPIAATSARQRAVSIARGGLDAAGRALSPFIIGGRQRWFVEPPHMQVSMVFLPAEAIPPSVGDEVDVRVRHTITTFDRVVTS